MTDSQKLTSGNSSENYQAGRDIIIGATLDEVRSIAEEVFRKNFLVLSEHAGDVARKRAAEFLEAYIKGVAAKPELLQAAQDPDMQYTMFNAQKAYARSGSPELAVVLHDVLLRRAREKTSSLLAIVLNESIETAPKLTPAQFDLLTLVFLLRYTRLLGFVSISHFYEHLKNTVLPFVPKNQPTHSSFQHLEFLGCGTVQMGHFPLLDSLRKTYNGLWWSGATKEEFDTLERETDTAVGDLICPCHRDPDLFQFNCINEQQLREKLLWKDLSEEVTNRFVQFFKAHLLSDEQVKLELLTALPQLERLFSLWENTKYGQFTLTSVGIAIAHANIRRHNENENAYDLSTWINEAA